MLKQLRAYYDANGISAVGFCCKHQAECSAGAPGFTAAKETFVGPKYITSGLPRLVFLSLDSGSGKSEPATRTMEAVQRRNLDRNFHELPKNNHWYQTHDLALTLLQPFDPSLRIERVLPHFAHVNSAKCCQNNPEHRKADRAMFENCRDYIGEEIRILRPDILVTQGKEARQAVEHHFAGLDAGEVAVDAEGNGYRVIQTAADHHTIWFATHHPRNYGRFWEQKRTCWSRYAQAAVGFVNGTPFEWTDTDVAHGVKRTLTKTTTRKVTNSTQAGQPERRARMSAAARKAVSVRMRKYWAARRRVNED